MSTTTQPQTPAPAPHQQQQALQAELRELLDVVGPSPLVDLLLERAFRLKATDIHLDPTHQGLRVRLRVDGMLHDILMVPANLMPPIISRLKLLAGMDITERRLSQDGQIRSEALGLQRDIRVGSGPTVHGERLVLRLMPDATEFGLTSLHGLGLDDDQVAQVQTALAATNGLVLVVGPVGSGKSSTIYTCLETLNRPTESVVTIEDPVERRMPGANQIQVDPKINFGFVEALRGVLRQDPDILMVGEIRDPETTHIAVRAGLTGILVLSTLHATDTASCLDVFRDFGVPPLYIADSLQGIIAQRLLRRVCTHCAVPHTPTELECTLLGLSGPHDPQAQLQLGKGCGHCFGTGYRGRTGVFEVLRLTREVRQAILHGKNRGEIMALARQQGMRSLEEAAIQKIKAGITTIEEMHRIMTVDPR